MSNFGDTKDAKIVSRVIPITNLVAEFSAAKISKIPPLRTVDYAPTKAIKVLSIGVLFRTLPL